MIDLYFWPTPNGHKISIMLEEVGLPYRVKPIDIGTGAQFAPRFLKVSPNNKIPAIVDHAGPGGKPLALFESGAILQYLAEKSGKLMPRGTRDRYAVIQWLMFQMAGVGPMSGQAGHFMTYAPKRIPYAVKRYRNEVLRLYGVMDRQLAKEEFLAGRYSIADIATYPWIRPYARFKIDMAEFPHLHRWVETVGARKAVQRGLAVMADSLRSAKPDAKQRAVLFGKAQLKQGR